MKCLFSQQRVYLVESPVFEAWHSEYYKLTMLDLKPLDFDEMLILGLEGLMKLVKF